MRINPAVIKILGDIVIPVLGFFWWNWSLYFILLFYFLDLFIREIIQHLETKKIKAYAEKISRKEWIRFGAISGTLLIIIVFLSHVFVQLLHRKILFQKEIVDFLTYEEMGIQQGYILLPLLIFAGYAQYRNEFLIPKKFQRAEAKKEWKIKIKESAYLVLLCVLNILIALLASLPEVAYLLEFVLLTSAYRFWKMRE